MTPARSPVMVPITIVHNARPVVSSTAGRKRMNGESWATRRFILIKAFVALLVAMMLSFAEAANVQAFYIAAGNSDFASLTLNAGQYVSGSFTVAGSVAYDLQIDFWVTNPQGTRLFDYGLVSGGAEFNFTANEDGIYTLEFFNSPSLSSSEKTVTLNYDVTTPEASSPDYLFYSVLIAIVLALAVTFIFIAYDRRKPRQSVKQFKRAPMVRLVSD